MDIEGDGIKEFAQVADEFADELGDAVDDGVEDSLDTLRRRITGTISSRGLMSESWRSTDGPSMNTFAAWPMTKLGSGTYTVRPHPDVRERAIALEFGRDPAIHASPDTTMTFQVSNGEYITMTAAQMEPREESASGWWRQSVKRWEAENNAQSEVSDEIDKLITKYFR